MTTLWSIHIKNTNEFPQQRIPIFLGHGLRCLRCLSQASPIDQPSALQKIEIDGAGHNDAVRQKEHNRRLSFWAAQSFFNAELMST